MEPRSAVEPLLRHSEVGQCPEEAPARLDSISQGQRFGKLEDERSAGANNPDELADVIEYLTLGRQMLEDKARVDEVDRVRADLREKR